jgi:hypothetical protein
MSTAQWAAAGFEPHELADWWRAGCWHPTAARALDDAGLSPRQLLDATGQPRTIDALSGVPVATAVADGYITAERAAAMVKGTSTLRWARR